MAIDPHHIPAAEPLPYSIDIAYSVAPDVVPMAAAPEILLAAAAIALLTPLATRSARSLGVKGWSAQLPQT